MRLADAWAAFQAAWNGQDDDLAAKARALLDHPEAPAYARAEAASALTALAVDAGRADDVRRSALEVIEAAADVHQTDVRGRILTRLLLILSRARAACRDVQEETVRAIVAAGTARRAQVRSAAILLAEAEALRRLVPHAGARAEEVWNRIEDVAGQAMEASRHAAHTRTMYAAQRILQESGREDGVP